MKTRPFLFIFALLSALTAAACSSLNTSGRIIRTISVTEARQLILDNDSNTGFEIIDVRTPNEYSSGHIPGALNIDFSSTTFEDDISPMARNDMYLVYCASGYRSSQALSAMDEMLFEEVYNMDGGFTSWQNSGYPVE